MKNAINSKMVLLGILTIVSAGIDAYLTGGDYRTILLAVSGSLTIVIRRFTAGEMRFLGGDK